MRRRQRPNALKSVPVPATVRKTPEQLKGNGSQGMRRTSLALIAATPLLLAGCFGGRGSVVDVPARIVNPSPTSRFELTRTVMSAVNDTAIALADDALTETSSLTLERSPPRSIEGEPATGRLLDQPVRFRLVLNGANCVLINEADGRRWRLSQTECVPE